jgi:simple sugar transport system ATP-binding protein
MNISATYEIQNISKCYGNVKALNDVSLSVKRGEIIGLVGDNGAGKSTLVKILSGVTQPDSGKIFYHGKQITLRSYKDSQKYGIATIYQERALVDCVSIYRNIFMGNEIVNSLGFLKKRKMQDESMRVLEESIKIGINSPNLNIEELSGGQKQAVAIVRAIYFKAKLLLLDEPTNHLSVREYQKVLRYVELLRDEGISSIFVTHNLLHIHSIADRFICLNNGEKIGEFNRNEIAISDLEKIIVMGKVHVSAGSK